jgi:hypothetical protein
MWEFKCNLIGYVWYRCPESSLVFAHHLRVDIGWWSHQSQVSAWEHTCSLLRCDWRRDNADNIMAAGKSLLGESRKGNWNICHVTLQGSFEPAEATSRSRRPQVASPACEGSHATHWSWGGEPSAMSKALVGGDMTIHMPSRKAVHQLRAWPATSPPPLLRTLLHGIRPDVASN